MTRLPYSLRLLGGVSLDGPEGRVEGSAVQRHRLALLALLAAALPGAVSRDKLVAWLWPESDAARARNSLNQAVHALRRALGAEAVLSSGDDLRLNAVVVESDVASFRAALAVGDAAGAVACYGGPFLDGFFLGRAPEFERWAEGERERLAADHAGALERLAEQAAAAGDPAAAAGWWRRLAAEAPGNSRVVLRLMQALDAAGDRAGAIRHARLHATWLREELDAGPDPEVAALLERLRQAPAPPGLPAAAPAHGAGPALARADEEAATGPEGTGPVAPHPPPAAQDVALGAPGSPRGSRWRRLAYAAAALVLLAAGFAALRLLRPPADDAERSIVVLPFTAVGSGEETEYFGEGLTEEVISRLSAVPGLRVISRNSAERFRDSDRPLHEIARELRVEHVLTGSVRESDGRLRISAQLLDASADHYLWSQQFEHTADDVFRVQQEIASAVVDALEVELDPRARSALLRTGTSDPEAYRLYQRGRYFWNLRTREGNRRAVAYYQRAIQRDSTFAAPWAGLADVYLTDYQYSFTQRGDAEAYARLTHAAERALALDPQSAAAHTSLAISLWWQRNLPGADRELRRALELNPGHVTARAWYSMLLAGMGRLPEAHRQAQRALELDPVSPGVAFRAAWILYLAGDYEASSALLEQALEIVPEVADPHAQLALNHALTGRHDTALQHALTAQRLAPANTPWYAADVPFVLARAGRHEEARAWLRQSNHPAGTAVNVARAWAALGEPDSAFAWLERADWRWMYRGVRVDPGLEPLHSDPRWARLTARVDREFGLR